ncbi:hypothetical protein E3J61_03580 [Candidatus Dependentiae bacterium]|nr:MAG: hypothetical protein E3J61_03580 [Candidatus Dependentiae bacterium]
MNSTKSFIAMALITSLAMQPIAAQPVEQTAKRQSKIVKQLEDSYKNLTQHLKCAVKRNCTPEEKKRIRRTALAIIGTLIAAYLVKRAWPRRVAPPPAPQTAEERLAQTRDTYLSQHKALRLVVDKHPDVGDDVTFQEQLQTANRQAGAGAYYNALRDLNIASARAQELISK